jgi:CopG-like RHH_1 or ribbon-helix-helix domain, RHH_5
MASYWRVSPPEHLDREVHQLALSENRSTSNMLLRLVVEAIQARRKSAERSSAEAQS